MTGSKQRTRHPTYTRLGTDIVNVDEMFSGGWSRTQSKAGFLIQIKRTGSTSQGGRARISGKPKTRSIVRELRPTAPRSPAMAGGGQKHFGLIHTVIYKQAGGRDATLRAVYIEAGGQTEGLINADARATNTAIYAEGGVSKNPERVVWTASNIADTYEERIAFFRKTTARARFEGDATVSIDLTGHEDAWRAIGRENMQRDVGKAYDEALEGDGKATIVINSADKAWKYSGSRKHRDLFDSTLSVVKRSNGITMSSIIVPLPHDLSAQGKTDLASQYSAFFAERKLPYQAVIHAPVEGKNDQRNWHMHINYYPSQVYKGEDGLWSFEKRRYHDVKNRKYYMRVIDPVERYKESAGAAWIPDMKEFMCAAANAKLEQEGLDPRFTTLTNAERGRDVAEERRGMKINALEKSGERSLTDIEAITRQWTQAVASNIEKRTKRLLDFVAKRFTAAGSDASDVASAVEYAHDAADLNEVIIKAKWKKREIESGTKFVRAEQEKILQTAGAEKKFEEAQFILKTLDHADLEKAVMIEQLDKIIKEAKLERNEYIKDIANDLRLPSSIAPTVEPIASMIEPTAPSLTLPLNRVVEPIVSRPQVYSSRLANQLYLQGGMGL